MGLFRLIGTMLGIGTPSKPITRGEKSDPFKRVSPETVMFIIEHIAREHEIPALVLVRRTKQELGLPVKELSSEEMDAYKAALEQTDPKAIERAISDIANILKDPHPMTALTENSYQRPRTRLEIEELLR